MSNNYIAVAKFYVSEVRKNGQPNYQTGKPETTGLYVVLSPVQYKADDPTHENSKFWNASPSGKFELWIQNAALFDKFIPGQEVYLPMMLCDGLDLATLSNALHAIDLPRELTES